MPRLVGVLGIAFVVVTIAPAFFLPPPPPAGAAAAEISRYYIDHRDALLFAGWFGLLGFPLACGYFAGLTLLLRGDDAVSRWLATASLLAIAITFAVALIQALLALAVPFVAGAAAPDQLKLVADITQLGFSVAFAPEIAYFIAVGLLIRRTAALPVWLGYAAFGAAAVALVATLGVVNTSGSLAPGGLVTLVGFVATMLWWLVAAVALVVRRPAVG